MSDQAAHWPSKAIRATRRMRPKPSSWVVVSIGIVLATLYVAGSTYSLLTPRLEEVSRTTLIALITTHVLIALVCAALVIWRGFRLFANRRDGLAGSQLHVRLVIMFSLIAVTPAVLAFTFSALILRSSLDEVFSERIGKAVEAGRDLANGYFDVEANAMGAALLYTQADLQRAAQFGATPQTGPIAFHQYLAQQAVARGFAGLYLLDADRRILDRVYLTERGAALAGAEDAVSAARYPLPPRSSFDAVDDGGRFKFSAVDPEKLDVFYALLKLDRDSGGYLVAYKTISPDITASLLETREVRDDYFAAARAQRRLENVYALAYFAIGAVVLFGAVWLGLWAATTIVKPVAGLVSVAEKVYSGDYEARASVEDPDTELGVLARTFNRMTAQVQSQQNDLRRANAQVERRSRFTEAVLSGVSAGVVGVSPDGRVTIANEAALNLLGQDRKDVTGTQLSLVAPELAHLVFRSHATPGYSETVEVGEGERARTFNVRVTRDTGADAVDRPGAVVLTFDDVTELVSAQRSAAWGDVARRIAHEIKNPLTPIQLSAERLQRKYRGEITSSPEIFDRCTETIVRQVKDIGRMVDEFSGFARMPKPVFAAADLREIVKATVFDRRLAAPEVAFEVVQPPYEVEARCDGRLIAQALGNLLKNAAESVSERLTSNSGLGGVVRVSLATEGSSAVLTVADNGVGLPEAERLRLTEPYVTTRERGTGLGLAIVKKIAEEHGGSLTLSNGSDLGPTGAEVRLSMPLASTTTDAGTPVEDHRTNGDHDGDRSEPDREDAVAAE